MSDVELGRLALRTFRVSNPYDHKYPQPRILMSPSISSCYDEIGPYSQMTSIAARGLAWSDGTCSASCVSDMRELINDEVHEAPGKDCGCGIYGTLSLYHLKSQYPSQANKCVAVIAAEGNTLMGSRGLRTQYARVIAYWCVEKYAPICIRQFEGAKHFCTVKEMLDEFGIPEITEADKKNLEGVPFLWGGASATVYNAMIVTGGISTIPPAVENLPAVKEDNKGHTTGWSVDTQKQQTEAKKALLDKLLKKVKPGWK